MATDQRLALVVDDQHTNRLLAAMLLRKTGWTVLEAESGESALSLVEQNAFRLILLDISMPGMSGEETCAQLRRSSAGRTIKIIAYTAHAFPEDRTRLLSEGFDDVLVKPISRQLLEDMVAGL